MGKSPQCSKDGLNKGSWTALEDKTLADYIKIHGEGKWSNVAQKTGLKRCGKSCRLRWLNYLRPDIKRGNISNDEEELIMRLHKLLGNRWALIAGRLPGRTDNEIKNYWNSNLAKKVKELQQVQSKNKKKPIIRPPSEALQDSKQSKTVQCTLVQDKDENNDSKVEVGPLMNGKLVKSTGTVESELSEGSSSFGKENCSNFMMDFNVDDICKILDSDFTKLSDIVSTSEFNNVIEGDCDSNNGSKSKLLSVPDDRPPMLGGEKVKENWNGSEECVQAADMGLDFLPLPSFLDSAQDWTADDLNFVFD